jgi:hypothetical protein
MTVTKERLIYTAGTFKITDELANCRRLVVRSSMLRRPNSARYWNERSNPIKYFFGYVSIFINDYVYTTIPLEFEQQIVLFWDNPEKQLYARLLCEAANNTSNLVSLRTSIPLAGVLLPLPGEPGSFSGCPYTNLKFKLEFGARILVTGVGDETEVCDAAPFDTILPNLAPPPSPYPDDQARDEDPPRSVPEEGELPGDTAPVTPQDPESDSGGGVSSGTWTLQNTEPGSAINTFTLPGLSTDTFAIVSGAVNCTKSTKTSLIKNGSEVVFDPFNCNDSGFVSSIISAVFDPD